MILIGMPYLNGFSLARASLDCWMNNYSGKMALFDFVVFINNAKDLQLRDYLSKTYPNVKVVRNPTGYGMVLNLAQLAQLAKNEYGTELCGMVHCDTFIWDGSWPGQVEEFFRSHPKSGMIGLFGALGCDETGCRISGSSNLVNGNLHGLIATEPKMVSVLDGFVLFFRTEALLKCIDLQYIFQGQYDYDLSMEMIKWGWENWLLPLRCSHVDGISSNTEEYGEILAKLYVGGYEAVNKFNYDRWVKKWGRFCAVKVEGERYVWRNSPNG